MSYATTAPLMLLMMMMMINDNYAAAAVDDDNHDDNCFDGKLSPSTNAVIVCGVEALSLHQ